MSIFGRRFNQQGPGFMQRIMGMGGATPAAPYAETWRNNLLANYNASHPTPTPVGMGGSGGSGGGNDDARHIPRGAATDVAPSVQISTGSMTPISDNPLPAATAAPAPVVAPPAAPAAVTPPPVAPTQAVMPASPLNMGSNQRPNIGPMAVRNYGNVARALGR